MSGNDLPQVGGVDHGIWRRLRLIPWSVTIPDHEKRPMEQVLAESEAERSGILYWLIEGLCRYMVEGLKAPPEILETTMAYREEMDPIGSSPVFIHKEDLRRVAPDPVESDFEFRSKSAAPLDPTPSQS